MLTMAILFISNPPATSAFNMERTCAPQVNIRPPILWLFMRAVWRTERTEDRWLHARVGSCVTSIAGPNGYAQLYERWRRALRGRQSGADLKPPQAAVVKSGGGEHCGKVGTRFRQARLRDDAKGKDAMGGRRESLHSSALI